MTQGYAPSGVLAAYEEKLAINLRYLEGLSFRTDLWIAMRTAVWMLQRRGVAVARTRGAEVGDLAARTVRGAEYGQAYLGGDVVTAASFASPVASPPSSSGTFETGT